MEEKEESMPLSSSQPPPSPSLSSSPIISSRLLIWPRRRRRKIIGSSSSSSSPDDQSKSLSSSSSSLLLPQSGYVLGWKQSKDHHREIVLCLGILPSNIGLDVYRKQIKRIVNKQKQSSSSSQCSCCCLINDSLDIVGYFDTTKQRQNERKKQQQQPDDISRLPIISLRRGYPWWEKKELQEGSGDDNDSNDNPNLHRQVLYYNIPKENDDDKFSHLSSEYEEGGNNYWHKLLYQLNHSLDIYNMILKISHQECSSNDNLVDFVSHHNNQQESSSSWNDNQTKQQGSATTSSADTNVQKDSHHGDDLHQKQLQKQQYSIFTESVTYLHFQQRYRHEKESTKTLDSGGVDYDDDSLSLLFKFIPLFQCIHLYNKFMISSSSSPNLKESNSRYDDSSCPCCGKPTVFISKSIAANRYVTQWDKFLSTALDAILGIGTSIIILFALRYYYYSHDDDNHDHNIENDKNDDDDDDRILLMFSSSLTILRTCFDKLKQIFLSTKTLQENISWLEEFPAGFKLNVRLTTNMGNTIRKFIDIHQNIITSLTSNSMLSPEVLVGQSVAIISATFGFSCFLATIIDLWRILYTSNVTILVVFFRKCYQMELYLLGAFFRLFRGKKYNVLRQRTDSMSYDAMQLLVGTIGFCIAIFVWTTIMVYYTFFVIWNIVLHIPIICLWIVYILTTPISSGSSHTKIPWGSMFWRIQHPDWFTENVYIQTQQDTEYIHVGWLFPISKNPIKMIISSLSIHLTPLLKWFINFCLEILIPRSSNESPYTIPFQSLLMQTTTTQIVE